MSNLLVQNIKHTNNTTSMAIDTSGQVTIRGEGSATTTNLQQGLAKVFSSLAHESGTPTAKDTFNVSSYSDNGTGNVKVTYTNSMSVANHNVVGMANYREGSAQLKHICRNENASFNTGYHFLISGEGTFTTKDAENMSSTSFGDLA
tara:strand:- start:41 stop:481 length:441 start_codon:yes stop_codon:yes gene_type:complete